MPPAPSDNPPRSPADFASLLATAEPLFLVGGQAVNLWALYYASRTADLAPFVSRDVDVLGDRNTLVMLAKTAGTKPQFFPLCPPTNEVGVIIATDGNGLPLPIEVLRHVHGVTNEELRERVYTVAIAENHVLVQVPGPIALIQAKIANVADLAQAERQDARHVLILARLMPAYLADLEASLAQGRMDERTLVGLLERLLLVVMAAKAKKVLRRLEIDRRLLFSELKADPWPRVRAFIDKRLPRCLRDTKSN